MPRSEPYGALGRLSSVLFVQCGELRSQRAHRRQRPHPGNPHVRIAHIPEPADRAAILPTALRNQVRRGRSRARPCEPRGFGWPAHRPGALKRRAGRTPSRVSSTGRRALVPSVSVQIDVDHKDTARHRLTHKGRRTSPRHQTSRPPPTSWRYLSALPGGGPGSSGPRADSLQRLRTVRHPIRRQCRRQLRAVNWRAPVARCAPHHGLD